MRSQPDNLHDSQNNVIHYLTYYETLFQELKVALALYTGRKVSIVFGKRVFDVKIVDSQDQISISFIPTNKPRPRYREMNWLIWFLERFVVPREYRKK